MDAFAKSSVIFVIFSYLEERQLQESQSISRKFYHKIIPVVLPRKTIFAEAPPKFYYMFPQKSDHMFTYSVAAQEWHE